MNGTYADVHRWNDEIVQVHQQTGVPANVIKAIMWIESRGRLNARSPLTSSGYYFGLMQIGRFSAVPEHMKDVMWMCDNAFNQTFAGGTELVAKSRAINSTSWDLVAGAYFGFGTDVTGTTYQSYINMFRQHVVALSGTTPGATDWDPPPFPTPGPTSTVVPVNFGVGAVVEVAEDRINIRSQPSLRNNTPIGVLLPGTKATVLSGPTRADEYDWFQVRTETGVTGWVAGQLLKLSDGSTPGTVTPTRTPIASPTRTATAPATAPSGQFAVGDNVIVDVPLLNMRNAPNPTATVLSVLPEGAGGVVTGTSVSSGGYIWVPVTMSGRGSGWVATMYLAEGGSSTSTMTPTATAPIPSSTSTASIPSGGFAVGDAVVVDVFMLNMRIAPSLSATVLSVLPDGTRGTVTGTLINSGGYIWAPVSMNGHGSGWVATLYLVKGVGSTATMTPTVTRTPVVPPAATRTATSVAASGDEVYIVSVPLLNLRENPTTSSRVLTTLTEGTMLTFLGGMQNANGYTWYEVETATHQGWIASDYVAVVLPTVTPTPTRTHTPAPTATRTPTPTATATTTRTSDSEIRTGDTVRITASLLNLRSGAGTNTSIIRTIPLGTTGTVMAGPQNGSGYAWFQIQTSLGIGWVASNYIQRQSVGISSFSVEAPGLTITETPSGTPVPTDGPVVDPTATDEPAPFDPTATEEQVVATPTQSPVPAGTDPAETAPESTATTAPVSPTETVAPPAPTPTATAIPDSDGDGVIDHFDRCPGVADSGLDSDGDGIDDACDATPFGEPTLTPTVPPTIPPEVPVPVVVELQVSAGADTSVSSSDPGAVQAADQVGGLPVGGPEGGVAYITFWVDGIGAGQVANALLYLPFVSGSGTVNVALIAGGAIDESTLTYGSAPGGSGVASVPAVAGSELPIDLTGWVTSDGPITIVVSGGGDPAVVLGSKEGGWPARLVITALG